MRFAVFHAVSHCETHTERFSQSYAAFHTTHIAQNSTDLICSAVRGIGLFNVLFNTLAPKFREECGYTCSTRDALLARFSRSTLARSTLARSISAVPRNAASALALATFTVDYRRLWPGCSPGTT